MYKTTEVGRGNSQHPTAWQRRSAIGPNGVTSPLSPHYGITRGVIREQGNPFEGRSKNKLTEMYVSQTLPSAADSGICRKVLTPTKQINWTSLSSKYNISLTDFGRENNEKWKI